MMRKWIPLSVLLMGVAVLRAQEGTMVPFDLPTGPGAASRILPPPTEAIAPDGPRVVVEGEQFTVNGKRFRGFGVNMAGSICPSRPDAESLAARLAEAGVNSVRLHGMEGAAWWVVPEDRLTDEQKAQRDQFDFFLAELARRGIYVNFNLHAFRKYSRELGLPEWSEPHDKIIDIFTPELIEAQKNHARRLLEHVNPYRKLRYADDPLVAFVEINNENSLFLWNAAELLPQLPEFYANLLRKKFNEFLRARYGTADKLRLAWGEALEEGESLEAGSVKLFGSAEKPGDPRVVDRMLCLMEVEQAYWDGMYEFVKKTLGYKGLVTGTIVFGPCNLYAQRNMDWIDCHAYWGHPRWAKGVPRWDSVRWTLPRAAMVDSPEKTVTDLDELSGILFYMASQQLRGKPFTTTEYNHCAPNDYQAECVPILSSFAALQDWDGLWFFTYEGRTPIHWFNVEANPAKWGFLAAGAALFRDGGLTALPTVRHLTYADAAQSLQSLVRHQVRRNYDTFAMLQDQHGVQWSDFLAARLVVNLDGKTEFRQADAAAASKLIWDKNADGKGRYLASGPGGRVWIGHAERLRGEEGLTVTRPHFAVVTLTPLDGRPLAQCGRALITAIFRAENTGMVFNEARDSVGDSWGTPPVLVEPIEGTLAGLEELKGQWTCTALKPDGSPGESVPVTYDARQLPRVELSAKYKTIWYLLERK